jgi:hypothetical protein
MVPRTEQETATAEKIQSALRNSRRRYVLYYLDHNGGVARLDELVDRVAAWESGVPAERVPPRKRESVYSSLYQTHLPKLEQIDLVSHDTGEGTVRTTETGERISIYCAPDTLVPPRVAGATISVLGLVLAVLVLGRLGTIPGPLVFDLSIVGGVGLLLVVAWQIYRETTWGRRYWQRGPDYIVDLDDDETEGAS